MLGESCMSERSTVHIEHDVSLTTKSIWDAVGNLNVCKLKSVTQLDLIFCRLTYSKAELVIIFFFYCGILSLVWNLFLYLRYFCRFSRICSFTNKLVFFTEGLVPLPRELLFYRVKCSFTERIVPLPRE